jgi:hypothetical protein
MSVISSPRVRKASAEVDFSKTREWIELHRLEYIGKWVVLDGDRLIGFGDDPRPIVKEARGQGVKLPFVEFIRDDSEPITAAWL